MLKVRESDTDLPTHVEKIEILSEVLCNLFVYFAQMWGRREEWKEREVFLVNLKPKT